MKCCKNCEHYCPAGASTLHYDPESCDRLVDANGNGRNLPVPLLRTCKHFEFYRPYRRFRWESDEHYSERLLKDYKYQKLLKAGCYEAL